MSISTEISRIQANKTKIRAKLVELGMATNTDNLDVLAASIEGLINRGAVSVEILEGTTYTIPAGYHNGSGTIKAMTDTTGEAESYKTQAKTATPTKKQQSITPDSGYYALSSVTVSPIPDAYQDVTSVNAEATDVLTGKIIVAADGTIITGTMTNNGAVSKTLDATIVSYTIPKGYHSGTGTVKISLEAKTVTPTKSTQKITPAAGKVLSEVTVNPIPDEYQDVSGVTATANKVLTGSKFVDAEGNTVNGTMADHSSEVVDVVSLTVDNDTWWPETGYHDGSIYAQVQHMSKEVTPTKSRQDITGRGGIYGDNPNITVFLNQVTVNPIPDEYQDVTGVTATADTVLTGSKFVNKAGSVVNGAMPNNGNVSDTIDGLTSTSVTIPAGYSSGGTVSLTNDIENALAAI